MENKININDAIARIESGENPDDFITVKQRITILEKIQIIEGIENENTSFLGLALDCITIKNGMMKVDHGIKEALTKITLVQLYSNIDLNVEHKDSMYELIMDSGIYDYVELRMDLKELKLFNDLLEKNIQQELYLYNNPVSVLNRKITDFINSIPGEESMKTIIESIKNLDEKKITKIKEMVNKYGGLN
jgi:hypothetical protein